MDDSEVNLDSRRLDECRRLHLARTPACSFADVWKRAVDAKAVPADAVAFARFSPRHRSVYDPPDPSDEADVLEQREAECQGHAYLYAALARSLGIPTRVVNGLVYSESAQGFLYHSWTESYLDDGWYAVDPTFAQPAADATHLKLIEGESIGDLLSLLDWVGKVHIAVRTQQ